MKKIKLTLLLAIIALAFAPVRAQVADTPFPYPTVPEAKTTLSERCNYLVDHFWERCDMGAIFTRKKDLNRALNDWLGFMPYATRDTIFPAIDSFLEEVSKKHGDNMTLVTKFAEEYLYSDSAEIYSEELYLPFCRAAVNNKKTPKAEKARYQAQLQILENSSLGCTAPAFEYTTPTGEKKSFGDIIASRIIVLFNDPDCFDCMMARLRLSADYSANELIKRGLLKVVCIYPGAPTQEWREAAATYPDNWEIGACEDIDLTFDIPEYPDIYYMDGKHKILGKHTPVDNMLIALQRIISSLE